MIHPYLGNPDVWTDGDRTDQRGADRGYGSERTKDVRATDTRLDTGQTDARYTYGFRQLNGKETNRRTETYPVTHPQTDRHRRTCD